MKRLIIPVDEKHELSVWRNDANGAVMELVYVAYRDREACKSARPIGHLFTFYDPEYTAEATVPHWEARLYFRKDHALGKDLGQRIGEILLNKTSCEKPMVLVAYPYLAYDEKLGVDNLSFAVEFGELSVPD